MSSIIPSSNEKPDLSIEIVNPTNDTMSSGVRNSSPTIIDRLNHDSIKDDGISAADAEIFNTPFAKLREGSKKTPNPSDRRKSTKHHKHISVSGSFFAFNVHIHTTQAEYSDDLCISACMHPRN